MLVQYYRLHIWKPSAGLLTRKCLEELNLAYVAEDLESAGELGGK